MKSTSILSAGSRRQIGTDRLRVYRTELDDRVTPAACAPARSDYDSGLIQGEVGRVEEVDLTRLRLDWIEPEPGERFRRENFRPSASARRWLSL
jgi:hypothetical protein